MELQIGERKENFLKSFRNEKRQGLEGKTIGENEMSFYVDTVLYNPGSGKTRKRE